MIRLAAAADAGIRIAAEAAYPEECCGLLVGHPTPNGGVAIVRAVASPNIVTVGRRHDRFEVDPQIRFDLMRTLAGTPLAIVGHYHSHPDREAIPSSYDHAMAFEANLVWLIAAVAAAKGALPRAEALRAWWPSATGFRELPLIIAPDDPRPGTTAVGVSVAPRESAGKGRMG